MKIEQLYIYPIKSCAPIELTEIAIDSDGPCWDRRFLIVDENLQFVTGRQLPELVLLRSSFLSQQISQPKGLKLNYQDESYDFFFPEDQKQACCDLFTCKIWKDEVPCFEPSSECSQFISHIFSRPLKLVQMSEGKRRLSRSSHDQSITGTYHFADAYPFLLTNTASLQSFSQKEVMLRYRPNIVVDSGVPYEEENWQGFTAGPIHFYNAESCSRCVFINVDPCTGERDAKNESALASLVHNRKKSIFGINLIHKGRGTISVGQDLLNFVHIRHRKQA